MKNVRYDANYKLQSNTLYTIELLFIIFIQASIPN